VRTHLLNRTPFKLAWPVTLSELIGCLSRGTSRALTDQDCSGKLSGNPLRRRVVLALLLQSPVRLGARRQRSERLEGRCS